MVLGGNPADNVKALYNLCQQLVPLWQQPINNDVLKWRCWFYVYLMWHESNQLTTRTQSPNGPGRGLMQIEPLNAFDTIDRYVFGPINGLMKRLADAAGVDRDTEMRPALKAFRAEGNPGETWPTSTPADQIEHWLLTSDAFGIELMQTYLAMFNASLPPLDLNNQTLNPRDAEFHAEFADVWANEWWKGDAGDRPIRVTRFLADATDLDAVVPP